MRDRSRERKCKKCEMMSKISHFIGAIMQTDQVFVANDAAFNKSINCRQKRVAGRSEMWNACLS